MDHNEKAKLDDEVAHMEENGYSEDQKQVYAKKYCTRQMDRASKAHWLEMGLLTLSVIAYWHTNSKLCIEMYMEIALLFHSPLKPNIIDSHENAATHVGVPEQSFDDEHEGKVKEIRHVWLDYVCNILEEKAGGPTPTGATDTKRLFTSPDGFPLFLPDLAYDKLKKTQCVKLIREYFKQNYLLATSWQSDDVPYKDMTKSAEDRRKFIHDQYLPQGFVMQDPHNLKLEETQQLIKFLIERQSSNEPAQVFQFHAFKLSRKGPETNPTIYPDEVDAENPPVLKKKVKRQPRTKGTNPRGAEIIADTERANSLGLNNPNLIVMTLVMTPTPEPPERSIPQLDITTNREGSTTIGNELVLDEQVDSTIGQSGLSAVSIQQTVGADQDSCGTTHSDFQWDNSTAFPTLMFMPVPTANKRNVFGMLHHIKPGPHQTIVGDWTTQFLGIGNNMPAQDYTEHSDFDFGNPNTHFNELGLAHDFGAEDRGAGADGINYGFSLNSPTDDTNSSNLGVNLLTSNIQRDCGDIMFQHNQTAYATVARASFLAWHQPNPQHLVMQDATAPMMCNNNQILTLERGNPVSHQYTSGQGGTGTRTVGSVASIQASAQSALEPRGRRAPKSGVSAEESGKGKRTADVLAAEEAREMAVPAKRQRRPCVRQS